MAIGSESTVKCRDLRRLNLVISPTAPGRFIYNESEWQFPEEHIITESDFKEHDFFGISFEPFEPGKWTRKPIMGQQYYLLLNNKCVGSGQLGYYFILDSFECRRSGANVRESSSAPGVRGKADGNWFFPKGYIPTESDFEEIK